MSLSGRTFLFNSELIIPEDIEIYARSDNVMIQTPQAHVQDYNYYDVFVLYNDGAPYFGGDSATEQDLMYENGYWQDEGYRLFSFVGDDSDYQFWPSEADFMDWLLANATEVNLTGYLSEFEAPDGSEYYFKDAQARTDIADLKDNQYSSSSAFPASGEVGKIYIAKDTNETYRWDSTTSAYVLIGSAGGGGSLLYILSFSILTTDWESITGGYGASITDSHVGTATEEIVVFDDSLTDLNANIFWEKDGSTHTMTFTSGSVPSATVSGKVFVFGDASGEVAYALPAVTSSDNGKVLGVINGAWAVMTIPSANGVSF